MLSIDIIFLQVLYCQPSFLFQLKTFSTDDYDKDWPHEHVNENSTRFTVTLSNLPTTDKKSRYAVHVGFVTKPGKDFFIIQYKSLQ